ncbi:MAG: prenyltransferase/squalene oxidase repeat-containing protein [Planctomycetota bacterium]
MSSSDSSATRRPDYGDSTEFAGSADYGAAPPQPPVVAPKQEERPAKDQPASTELPSDRVPVPPPPPRATAVPIRPSANPTANAPRPITPGSVGNRQKDPAVGMTDIPSAKVIGASDHPETTSRWRTDETLSMANDGKSTDRDDSPGDESLFEPVRRDVPAWLVSMIIHTIVLLILALWTTPLGQGISRVVLEFGEALEESPVDLDTFSIESSESLVDLTDADQDMPVDINLESDLQSLMSEEVAVDPPLEFGLGPTIASDAMAMFSGRSGQMKKALLAKYGGTELTMDAVDRGLRWLARQQDKRTGAWSMLGPYEDGSYSENRTAATAMALLAFLGDGHTHKGETEYASVVDQGIQYLLKSQSRRNGFFAGTVRGEERSYAQAQATIAICEAYAMTKDSTLRAPAQSALDYAADAQSPQGGWRYQPRFDSDLSVTGWFLMGLTSGKSAGLNVDNSILHQVTNYLNDIQSYDGAAYGYQRGRAPSPAMTAEGLLCRQYLGWPKTNRAMAEGISTLSADWPINLRDRNVYYWYYATQVMHHYGDSPWVEWNRVMREALPRIQVKRGRESGSWSPQGDEWGDGAGRLFTTCMSIYCLEVYYRHLPLYSIE